MNHKFMPALVATFIGGTVFTPHALGQESANLAQQGQSCEALTLLIQENPDNLRPEWIEEANGVVTTGVATIARPTTTKPGRRWTTARKA